MNWDRMWQKKQKDRKIETEEKGDRDKIKE